MASYSFTVEPVIQGMSFRVEVTEAPCAEVTVEFWLKGVLVATNTVSVVGSTTFSCPSGSDGSDWTITVRCPGDAGQSENGIVVP